MQKKYLLKGVIFVITFLTIADCFNSAAYNINICKSTESCDIPTWYIGDEWIYTADPVTYDSANGSFDGKIENLKRKVVSITTITHGDEQMLVYKLDSTGDISGVLTWGPLSGDLEGIIEGTSYIRVSDLAEVETSIDSTGIVEILFINRDYEMINSNSFFPPIELYDFPLKAIEQWDLSYTDYSSWSFIIEGIVDEGGSESNIVNEIAYCNNMEMVNVPAGDFDCFNISVSSDTYLYSPEVGNIVKTYVGGRDDTLIMDLTLESFSKVSQEIVVSENIDPSVAIIGQDVIISGQAVNSNSDPIQNGDISIEIPSIGESWSTTTDNNGYYNHMIEAPIIFDNTPVVEEIGSDGVIVRCSSGNLEGYIIKTLTLKLNYPPDSPVINGPNKGKKDVECSYEFLSTDPDLDDLYYYVDWGDESNSGWVGPYNAGQPVTIKHKWAEDGSYQIRAKTKDDDGVESGWRIFEISIIRERVLYNSLLDRVLYRFQDFFQIIKLVF